MRMSKPLIYTIATNDENAFSCSALLIKSLKRFLKDDFDFKIVVPESDTYSCSEELKSYIFPIYNYHYKNQHIFTLKYHYKIFDQPYDYFIYMDSDILWTIPKLYGLDYNCVCCEKTSMRGKEFSKFWPDTIDKSQLYKFQAINAGFFGLKKKIALDLSDFMIKTLYTKAKFKRPLFEQNMFNLFVYDRYLKTNTDNWQDISNKFVLGAQPDSPYHNNGIAYHFYGNMCQMNNKLERMTEFLNNNNIILE
jgi:hypothetical protein